ncbi:AAA family ATPase, partial [Puia sp.]|uniref:AAA family ATPase n=1 Tax=Puia sp. TaxID=2045100 RepID=UPI002F3F926A
KARRSLYDSDRTLNDNEIQFLTHITELDPAVEFLYFHWWGILEDLGRYPTLKKGDNPVLLITSARILASRAATAARKGVVAADPALVNDFFPIEWLRIQNFKGITDLTIDFKQDEPGKKSWLFLLGENGVGKSSILQAMAVGMKADKEMIRPLLPKLIRKGAEKAEITIKERNSDNLLMTVLTKDDIHQSGVFNSFLMGYGSLRLSGDEADAVPKRDEARISYENLFKPVRPLNDITKWLKDTHRQNPVFFDAMAYSIKQLLPHDFAENELTVNEEIMFKHSEQQFSELSDGFKSTIILAVDIMMKLSSAQADMDKMTGIVLIDELGNQLHPRWQMRIVRQLRTVFPNLNFIVSTHHPLCLRGSEAGEILLLKNVDNQINSITDLPDPAGLRVDQILASEFFGLNSLMDPALEAKFNRYYALLAREAELTGKEVEELFRLKDELKAQKQLGSSLRDELMYYAIDSLLASKLAYTFSRDELKEQVVTRVRDIWKKLNSRNHDQG